MIIEVNEKLISSELFDRKFVCDLNACKGACCVKGDAGAPIKKEEIELLQNEIEAIKPYMRPEGVKAIETHGLYYTDAFGEPVTMLVNDKECAFVYFDEQSIAKCAIEQAHREGKTTLKKPISCHLYPIRIKKTVSFEILNYDEWSICTPACVCGEKLDVPVYRFLKEPLIRAYGKDFFAEMELAHRTYQAYRDEKNESR
jgi:hypothetical protein